MPPTASNPASKIAQKCQSNGNLVSTEPVWPWIRALSSAGLLEQCPGPVDSATWSMEPAVRLQISTDQQTRRVFCCRWGDSELDCWSEWARLFKESHVSREKCNFGHGTHFHKMDSNPKLHQKCIRAYDVIPRHPSSLVSRGGIVLHWYWFWNCEVAIRKSIRQVHFSQYCNGSCSIPLTTMNL